MRKALAMFAVFLVLIVLCIITPKPIDGVVQDKFVVHSHTETWNQRLLSAGDVVIYFNFCRFVPDRCLVRVSDSSSKLHTIEVNRDLYNRVEIKDFFQEP